MTTNTAKLDPKAIKNFAVESLRAAVPGFANLKRSQKKEKIHTVVEVVEKLVKNGSDFSGVPDMTPMERMGLGKKPNDLMTLDDIRDLVEESRRTLIDLSKRQRTVEIQDPLLCCMEEHLDDFVINQILSDAETTLSKRDWSPAHYLRTELLRTALFSKLSVREFEKKMKETDKYKEEREFCGMNRILKNGRRDQTISHSALSSFRNSLSLAHRVNLMAYFAVLFLGTGRAAGSPIFALDSTEKATVNNPYALGKVELPDGQFIRFYADLDSDVGKRRKKRDKSEYVVGYRIHTLCVIEPETNLAFPLLSVAVAANHHDSQMLEPIVELSQAMGFELRFLLGDDAYADDKKKEKLLTESGLSLITQVNPDTPIPDFVEPDTGRVFQNKNCCIPMNWSGYDGEENAHLFFCGDDNCECPLAPICEKERTIPLDNGHFGPVPIMVPGQEKLLPLRKVTERPFNLIKHMDGMEHSKLKTMASISTQAMLSQTVGLFKVMAGLRAVPQTEETPSCQTELYLYVG